MKMLSILAATFALGVSAPAAAQDKQKVTVSWLPIMQTTAFYVALEEKLFEKAGIEVTPVRFEAPNQIIDSLVSGRADVGAPGAAAGISVIAEMKFPGSAADWKTTPRSGPGPAISRSATRATPSVGLRKPATMLSIVVLPHPDAPSSTTISHGATENDTSRITARPS